MIAQTGSGKANSSQIVGIGYLVHRDSNLGDWNCDLVHWIGNLGNWGNVVVSNWSDNLGDWDNGLDNLVTKRFTLHHGVKSIVFISGVVNNSTVSIGINQGVLSLNIVSVTFFLLALDVTSLFIMDRVLELVFSGSIGIFDVLDSLDQSRLQGLDQSWLHSFHQSWLSMVLRLLVVMRIVVLCSGNSHQSEQSNEL